MSNLVSLDTLTAGITPDVFQPELPFEFGGDLPLDNISAYKMSAPTAHWLLVTKGFHSFGYELTMRIASEDDTAPKWAVELLKSMSRDVFNKKQSFELGQVLPLDAPLVAEADCFLTSLFFVADPELENNGETPFICVAGITQDEALAAHAWKAEKIAQLLAFQVKNHIIDLRRFSVMKNENIAAAVARGSDTDGSDMENVPCGKIDFVINDASANRASIEFDAMAAEYLDAILPGRLPHGKQVNIVQGDKRISLIPSDEPGIKGVDHTWVEVSVTPNMYAQFVDHLTHRRARFTLDEFDSVYFSIEDYFLKDENGSCYNIKRWR
uniref:suppressor of fused domain protein n=1 Tax=Thaumasiovibrio occultus TaxID=1891184 RepID=UPI000B35903D|nr:suppressor of fused domain protein [Thaumasiovibrio occultus]